MIIREEEAENFPYFKSWQCLPPKCTEILFPLKVLYFDFDKLKGNFHGIFSCDKIIHKVTPYKNFIPIKFTLRLHLYETYPLNNKKKKFKYTVL